MPTTTFANWDFSNYHVQQEVNAGQFVSAESTLVAAGAPELASSQNQGAAAQGGGTRAEATSSVYPVGLLEQASIQQSKQLQRIFEIGSSRSYFVPGRVIGSVSLGRTFFYGPSLLRALYAYYGETDYSNNGMQPDNETPDYDMPLLASGQTYQALARSPGADGFYIDLASDMFSQPIGMAVYFRDIQHVDVGAFYLENCYVQGHQMTISSGSVLIMEGASLQYDMLRPIQMT